MKKKKYIYIYISYLRQWLVIGVYHGKNNNRLSKRNIHKLKMIPYQMNEQQGCKLLTAESRIRATSANENCHSVYFCNGLRRYILVTNKCFKKEKYISLSSLSNEKHVIEAHKNFSLFLFFSYRCVRTRMIGRYYCDTKK